MQPLHSPLADTRDITVPALAYLGDSVLEVCVRTYLVQERGLTTSARLNQASLDFVRATAQSEAMSHIEPHLTEAEATVYRRGRNIGHTNVPKSASVQEYRRATGMEALFGHLYLTGQTNRITALFRIGYRLDPSNGASLDAHTECKETITT